MGFLIKPNKMTPEQIDRSFKWFETFNNKELEKLYPYDDCSTFSPKLKLLKPETNA
jgi:hypothetical protein